MDFFICAFYRYFDLTSKSLHMRLILAFLSLLIISSCTEKNPKQLEKGYYRAELEVQDNEILPFVFQVRSANTLEIYNAEERIAVDDIEYRNDSVFIRPPVFEGYIAAVFDGDNLKGNFIKESLDRVVPFRAEFGNNDRFRAGSEPVADASGTWEVVFSEGIPEDEYPAKGIFKQQDGRITGTFRTTTGDYRFLEGVMDGNVMKLSAFDGAHAFYFKAEVSDSLMSGAFYSGNHFKEPFAGKRNPQFELPDADSLTFIKTGYEKFSFSFPDSSGRLVSLDDEEFRNKVVLVQVMGTWCPNCLDESKFYSEFMRENANEDLEIVALAFEYAKTQESAFEGISRLKERLGIEYPVLLAQYGTSSKTEAQKKLPMLNHVLSYPTTIFIDKNGSVRKIHTGFNGPATGEKFEEFKIGFTAFVDSLLKE